MVNMVNDFLQKQTNKQKQKQMLCSSDNATFVKFTSLW